MNPHAVLTSWRFQFGRTTAYGLLTPVVGAGDRLGAVPTPRRWPASRLARPTTTGCVAIRRGAIVAVGADRTFTTVRPVVVTPPPVATFSVAGARRQRLSSRTISVRVSCSLACTGRVSGRLKIGGRRGTIKLKAVNVNLAAGQTKRIKLRLTKKQAAAVRKALGKHKRVTVSEVISLRSGATPKTLRKTIVVIR